MRIVAWASRPCDQLAAWPPRMLGQNAQAAFFLCGPSALRLGRVRDRHRRRATGRARSAAGLHSSSPRAKRRAAFDRQRGRADDQRHRVSRHRRQRNSAQQDDRRCAGHQAGTRGGKKPVVFHDIGVGGGDPFDVSEPLFVFMASSGKNGEPADASGYPMSFGPVRLQLGQSAGMMDMLTGGLDVVGMPAMKGKSRGA